MNHTKILLLIVLVTLGSLVVFYFIGKRSETHYSTWDENTAREYVTAWAKKVSAEDDFAELRSEGSGDFFGQVGSLGFEYLKEKNALIVRAYVYPNDKEFTTSRDDLLPFLNQIAAKEPERVSQGVFEVTQARWEPDKEPSLFLRIEIRNANVSDVQLISRFTKLREDAFIWSRVHLTEALDQLVKERRRKAEK